MEIPKDDKKHVLYAKVTHTKDAKWTTYINLVNSLICAFYAGMMIASALDSGGSSSGSAIARLFSILFACTFLLIVKLVWPFKVTNIDWLMWKATKAEA